MTSTELQSMTVLQLRKLARDHQIKLSSGIDKAGIIEKLAAELHEAQSAVPDLSVSADEIGRAHV